MQRLLRCRATKGPGCVGWILAEMNSYALVSFTDSRRLK